MPVRIQVLLDKAQVIAAIEHLTILNPALPDKDDWSIRDAEILEQAAKMIRNALK